MATPVHLVVLQATVARKPSRQGSALDRACKAGPGISSIERALRSWLRLVPATDCRGTPEGSLSLPRRRPRQNTAARHRANERLTSVRRLQHLLVHLRPTQYALLVIRNAARLSSQFFICTRCASTRTGRHLSDFASQRLNKPVNRPKQSHCVCLPQQTANTLLEPPHPPRPAQRLASQDGEDRCGTQLLCGPKHPRQRQRQRYPQVVPQARTRVPPRPTPWPRAGMGRQVPADPGCARGPERPPSTCQVRRRKKEV
jgi:hypothetical protein